MSWLPVHFHFLQPDWLRLWFAVPVVMLLVYLSQNTGSLAQLADSALLPHVTRGRAHRRWLPAALIGLMTGLASLALAGPSWRQLPTPLMQQQPAQVLALSLSQSMYDQDLPPSRMERARFKASDLLKANAAGQNGLVGFAGDAFVVAPLTRDAKSLANLLAAMSPATMPVDGDRASTAIELAAQLLFEAKENHGLILLLTDSADPAAVNAAAAAHAKGLRVSVLGIGSNTRQPVTLPDGSLLHDATGNLVLSQRNDALLAQIASVGGGDYRVLGNDDADVTALEQGLRTNHVEAQRREISHWQDAGVWLLPPLLLLMLLLFRRGWLLMLLLMLPFALPRPALAASAGFWNDLWWRADQQAARALAQGRPEQAEALTDHPDWQGAGAYAAGHFDKAIEAFQRSRSPDASYNLGNALARAGKIDAAIHAYEQALKQNPDNTDAKTNLALLKKLQQQKNPQQNQQQQDPQQSSSDSAGDPQQNQQQNPQQGQSQNRHSQSSAAQGKHEAQHAQPSASTPDHKDSRQPSQSSTGDSLQHPSPSATAQQHQPSAGTASQARMPQEKVAPPQPSDNTTQPVTAAKAAADQQQTQAAQAGLTQQLDAALKDKDVNPPSTHQLGIESEHDDLDQLPPNARQLLLSVPDDPGALLKRKFQLEYQQRQEKR